MLLQQRHKRAMIANKAGKYQNAIEITKGILAENPKDILANATLALSYLNLKKFDLAEECINKALSIYPHSVDIQAILCIIIFLKNDYKKVIICSDHVLKNDPHNQIALDMKARALLQLKKYDLAEDCVKNLLQISPNSPDNLTLLADIYSKTNRFLQADELYKASLSIDPENACTLNNYAIFLSERNSDSVDFNVLDLYKSACRIAPNNKKIIENYENERKSLKYLLKDEIF